MSEREAWAKLDRVLVHLIGMEWDCRTREERDANWEARETIARILRTWRKGRAA